MFIFRKLEEEKKDENKCEMFGGLGILIQTLLGAAALCILILKRYLEKPRRPWKIWWYDVSKQIIGALFMHLFNLILSVILSDDEGDADACVWYFVTLFLDCTVGAFLSYIFMWLVDGIAKSSDWKFFKTGKYYAEYSKNGRKYYKLIPQMYLSQLGVWLGVNLWSKIVLIIMLKICDAFWVNVGVFILSPFTNGNVRLVMVLIILPIILNCLYFWIADDIIKVKEEKNKIPEVLPISKCLNDNKTNENSEIKIKEINNSFNDNKDIKEIKNVNLINSFDEKEN